jgi:hypothetical protein
MGCYRVSLFWLAQAQPVVRKHKRCCGIAATLMLQPNKALLIEANRVESSPLFRPPAIVQYGNCLKTARILLDHHNA